MSEISEIRALAHSVFEDAEVADEWLEERNLALNNRRPIELLVTPEGFEAVENLLIRIQYGVMA